MKTDSITLDFTMLQMNWAVDDVANAITGLMGHLEDTGDVEGLKALSTLVKAMNTYIEAVKAATL